MAEYIEREAVLAWKHGGVVDVADIKAIPAADVAPVVRCKDCVRCDEERTLLGTALFCEHWVRNTESDGYCHEGFAKGR